MQALVWLQRLDVSVIARIAGYVSRAWTAISVWRSGRLTKRTTSENDVLDKVLPSGVTQIKESQRKWELFNRQGYYVRSVCQVCEERIDSDTEAVEMIKKYIAKANRLEGRTL